MPAARPYLVVPRLIEQPTWGGTYILKLKHWTSIGALAGKKIGQSYEIFGKSKLLTTILDSADPRFLPEFAEGSGELIGTQIHDYSSSDFVEIASLFETPMNVLIKLNQAAGNSFQVHVHPGTVDKRWLPKPESWYFFEPGNITCGLKKGANIEEYKKVCKKIEETMQQLSLRVQSGELTRVDAQKKAKEIITALDPWQFVNRLETKKDDLVDLSSGAVHHSWEGAPEKFPLGNIVYELQYDVMDPYCTIRAFDQGKIKDDGTIREIHIDDYFKYIERGEESNDPKNMKRVRNGESLLKTPFYSLDILELSEPRTDKPNGSFSHLFVKEGEVNITAGGVTVHVAAGHSVFIPEYAESYVIDPKQPSVILKTYI